MIHFAWSWAVLLLPLPLVFYRLLPPALGALEAALWVPTLSRFSRFQDQAARTPSRWPALLAICCWVFLVAAAARPQWLGDPIEQPAQGRNLMLAVDLSISMKTKDFQLADEHVSRLTALKAVAKPFIERRRGDRLGLIVFGDQAYVQSPLTFDRQTVAQLLDETVLGLAGGRTAIGDAIGLAIKRLMVNQQGAQVLILMTDGASNAGLLSPQMATKLAAREGIKIYTIGLGLASGALGPNLPSGAELALADLDENSLRRIADSTGGRYFRALDSQRLDEIYAEIDMLEPIAQKPDVYRPAAELFPWPLGLALLFCTLILLVQRVPYRRRP